MVKGGGERAGERGEKRRGTGIERGKGRGRGDGEEGMINNLIHPKTIHYCLICNSNLASILYQNNKSGMFFHHY